MFYAHGAELKNSVAMTAPQATAFLHLKDLV